MSKYLFEQFTAVRNYTDLSFSPDGKWVAYTTNTSGQYNVWRQPVKVGPEGLPQMPVQLTALVENAARRAVWSPDGELILTIADFQGNENFQLYRIPSDQGWLYPITDQPEVRHEIGPDPFSPDGKFIAYASNERDRGDFDVIVHDLASGETKILLAGDAYYCPYSWSPDGRFVLTVKFNDNIDQDLFISDIQTGESKCLTSHTGSVKFLPAAWAPDSSGIYIVSDLDREFLGLAFLEIETGSIKWLETPDWDVQICDVSSDGRYLVWTVNEDGYSRLYLRDFKNDKVVQFENLPEGVIGGLRFNPCAPLIGLYLHRSSRPGNLYLLDINSGEFEIVTQSFLGGVPEEEMVEPELIRYKTFDGREIPAYLYKPENGSASSPVPVILSIHGGPEHQEFPYYAYNGFYQYLCHIGIGVLAPNVRGSTGYGKSYQKLIHRDWGGDELKDLEYAALYLKGLDWVNSEKLGVFGGSFGGFATLSCVSRLSDYWAAAVDIVGPSNLITFTKSVPPFWKRFMKKWIGDPDEDKEMLKERSPITYVNNIKAPLLIIQGANDPRVVKAESDQMVDQLKQLGREVEYMIFEDEGHSFTKTENTLKYLRASADWFKKHLFDTTS
jgi:dipeptidyl aminopeptidase/acylaminoacyl peptidase